MSVKRSAPRRRAEQKAATREGLKRAARACLAARGYEGTSIAAIAAQAGVAHGTVYVHFPSKEAVLDELLRDHNELLASRLGPVLGRAARAPLRDAVRAIAEQFLDTWASERAFVECYARRVGAHLDLATLRDGLNPPALALLTVALSSPPRKGRRRAVPPELASHALLAMWLRVGLQYLFGQGVTRAQAIATLVTLTTGAVSALMENEP